MLGLQAVRVFRPYEVLRHDFSDHTGRQLVGDAFLQPIPLVNEILHVESELMKECRMEVVYADPTLHGFVTYVVRSSVNVAPLQSAACHPHAESHWAVISAR